MKKAGGILYLTSIKWTASNGLLISIFHILFHKFQFQDFEYGRYHVTSYSRDHMNPNLFSGNYLQDRFIFFQRVKSGWTFQSDLSTIDSFITPTSTRKPGTVFQ